VISEIDRLYHLQYNPSPIIKLAAWAHHNQYDKSGNPYIFHPQRVAHRVAVSGASFHQVAAAWLHDTVEDTVVTFEMLGEYVPDGTIRMVEALTHQPNEPRVDYIARIMRTPGASSVKRADIADNMDPRRMEPLPIETQARLNAKYLRDLRQLGYEHAERPPQRQERPGLSRIVWGQGREDDHGSSRPVAG
jgi:hypothetical protein